MKKTFIPLFVGLLCWTGVQATVHYVRVTDGADDAARGTALKNTIFNAFSGDTVKVQAGTFTGNFIMKNGVNVSGGWNESFTSQTKYGTILDGNASGRVLKQEADFDQMTVWDNLTIQNGKLTSDGKGAGVYLLWKSKLTNCLIQNNTYASGVNCEGGGLAQDKDNNAGDVIADNCLIRNNKATHGGGVWIRSTITNCTIENNRAETSTGGQGGGGAVLWWGRMYNCIIRNNYAAQDAGGVRAYGNCKLINCLIADNSCGVKTAGLALERTLSEVINCTVVNNNQKRDTDKEYCGIRFDSDNADGNKFVNNVVWGNKADSVVQNQQVSYSICKYSNAVGNAFAGSVPSGYSEAYTKLTDSSDNTTDDGDKKAPHFTDPANGDYSLAYASPLRNEGNESHKVGSYDVAGLPRTVEDTVDIGAHECQWIPGDRTVRVGENLQNIIDHTFAGNSVKVQAGTFNGNFTMRDNVQVSGGWNENFTSQTDHATILDANNKGRVLHQAANFNTLTVWSNFIIQHGKLTAKLDTYGAGVFLRKNGQVKHCIIQDNTFTYSGDNCVGGGVANNEVNENSDVLVDDCIIRRNNATHGGGVRIVGTIQNSVIEEDSTTNNAGGGVQLFNGGRMYNCIIRNNTSGGDVGGVRMNGTPSGVLANCLIVGNHAASAIGGLALENSDHTVFNNTIVGNSQSSSNPNRCGVHLNVGGTLAFCNNIVWGNKANDVVQASQMEIDASYSNQSNNFENNSVVWNGKLSNNSDFSGNNTVRLDKDTDPGFTDAANGDYTLAYPSGMIDSGHNGRFADGYNDLNGSARKIGTIDRGCYELAHYTLALTSEHATVTAAGNTLAAGDNFLPKGYTASATIAPEEGYRLTSVAWNDSPLSPDGEGNYTIPALNADAAMAVTALAVQNHSRTIPAGYYGTICLDYPVAAADIEGAKVYKVQSFATSQKQGILLEQVDDMVAGKPYIFLAEANPVSFKYIQSGDPAVAGDENGLHGVLTNYVIGGQGYYVLQDNEIRQMYDGSAAVNMTIPANRAYIVFSEIPEAVSVNLSPRHRVIGIHHAQNGATAINSVTGTQSPSVNKVIKDGRIMIIREGKKYTILGQTIQ